jgi:hypothetical protein
MDRREVLKLLASTAVLPALSPDAFAMFRRVHAQIAEAPGLKTLNPRQNATVTVIAELIIPQTDTPGAKTVKVNEFIDLILTDWYDEANTVRFLAGLSDVDERSQRLFGNPFAACTEAQQNQVLKVLDEEAMLFAKQNELSRNSKDLKAAGDLAPTNFFYTMKKLTLIGYYTSEAGFEEELHESIIPPHAGCVPISAEANG